MAEQEDYGAAKARAMQLLAGGDARGAFDALRPQLSYPGRVAPDEFADALAALAQVCAKITGPDWAAHVHRAARRPNDVDALFELGYQLIEQSLDDLAATVLLRAHQLQPQAQGVLTELAIALEGAGRHISAVEVLHDAPQVLRDSVTCRYLLAFNTLMTADVEGARREADNIRAPASDADAQAMVAALRHMLARAEALAGVAPLDDRDLRGWHAVINGGLLLHLSPYGLDEPMRGRYAFVQDAESRVLEGINRLVAALDSWGLRPPRVLTLADRESEALGFATAEVLGVVPERFVKHKRTEGLIVVYDLATQPPDILELLALHRPAQPMWVHAATWTSEPPFVADATTYLYEHNVNPWEAGRRRVNPQTQQVQESPAVEGNAKQLAASILASGCDFESMTDLDALTTLAKAMRRIPASDPAAFGVFRDTGPRLPQRIASPVPSARFA